MSCSPLLFDGLDTLPLALEVLLPQTDLVVSARHGQHVPAQAPAHAPQHSVKGQYGALPLLRLAARCRRRRPDAYRLVLRSRGNVRLGQDRWRPRHVPHPVRVAGQHLGQDV